MLLAPIVDLVQVAIDVAVVTAAYVAVVDAGGDAASRPASIRLPSR